MAGQIAIIILHVDLSCPKCYSTIRQVLCKFNCQIQSKVFDEDNNTVTITGFFYPCCKFARKLCRRAGKAIKKIDIKQNQNTDQSEDPKPETPTVDNPPPVPPEPVTPPEPAPPTEEPEPQPPPKTEVPHVVLVPVYPPPQEPQFWDVCCGPCYQGYGIPTVPPPPYYDYSGRRPPPCSCGCGGYRRCSTPSYDDYGRRTPPCSCGCGGYRPCSTPSYDDYGKRPPPCSCGCGGYRRCSTPCEYINEEDPSACAIM